MTPKTPPSDDEKAKRSVSSVSPHSEIDMVSIDEATRRHFERQAAARERDAALGWPEPPQGRRNKRRRK